MNLERILQVLLAPHVSEKSTRVAESNQQHVFKVLPDATKGEIKEAVEELFKVQVSHVRVLNVKGKTKRFGQREGNRSNWRKAYVTLAAGQDIDFAGGK
ncbi:MAG: 50S ribosomal protein L23 [Gammaproteobacteria bacterium]|nr:50S ribosomal protein L23 [Gammaproteobacteria bacterium]